VGAEAGQAVSVETTDATPPRIYTRATALSADEIDALVGIADVLDDLSE
jgi:hypothetical protein